ncbi:hypothetical protein BDW22DRAFT_1354486, partial [Trametopsis cervina]
MILLMSVTGSVLYGGYILGSHHCVNSRIVLLIISVYTFICELSSIPHAAHLSSRWTAAETLPGPKTLSHFTMSTAINTLGIHAQERDSQERL